MSWRNQLRSFLQTTSLPQAGQTTSLPQVGLPYMIPVSLKYIVEERKAVKRLAPLVAVWSLTLLAQKPIDWRTIAHPDHEVPIHQEFKAAPLRLFNHGSANLDVLDPWDNHPRNRPVSVDMEHYGLSLNVDPTTGHIEGKASLRFRALRPVGIVEFDAYDMLISAVNTPQGEALPFAYDGDVLQVFLHTPMQFNETKTVEISYRAERAQSFYLTGPDATNPQRMTAGYTFTQPEDSRMWFPSIDRPADKALLDVELSVPNGFNGLSNGKLVALRHLNDQVVFQYKMEQPIAPYLVSLAVGTYQVHYLGHFKGKPLTLWAPPAIQSAALAETRRTLKMMESFSRFTGLDYPFASYAQSVAQAWGTSMEHQTATTMGGWRIVGDGSGEGVVAHELAHQWFGDWVTCERWSELWLNEGFASYLPYVFFRDVGAHNAALGYEDYWRSGYFEEAQKRVHPLSSPNADFDMLFDSHAYEKGALVIKLMRHVADSFLSMDGEENFTKALRLYLTQHGTRTVRNTDLQAALETVTGTSWQVFFDQWVRSAGHPRATVQWKNKEGGLALSLTQDQSLEETKWTTFQFPLEVEAIGANDQRWKTTLDVFNSTHEFTLNPGFEVLAINADPRWLLPAEFTVKQDSKAWLAVLKHSPFLRARINAARALLALDPVAQEEFTEALLDGQPLYLVADAWELLTKKHENKKVVERLLNSVGARKSEWDRIIQGAYAATEAWLLTQREEKPTGEEVVQWEKDYLLVDLSEERKAVLDKLIHASLAQAQRFALDRLNETNWVTKDRAYLIDVLAGKPTEVSIPFLENSLRSASYFWFRRIVGHLVKAKFDRPSIVPTLIEQANEHRFVGVRLGAIDLLAEQVSSKTLVCPALTKLRESKLAHPDLLQELREKAGKAFAKMNCDI
ncbi:MAG: M1 family metallopeptidase [Deltaproteobacteria bacterium]|nr:M1 family metallopeptidase [Deltaproteobacteria bacterium]